MWGPNTHSCTPHDRLYVEGEVMLGMKPTSDQVKGPPVLWVWPHLTGQEVQLGWRSIDLKTDTDADVSVYWENLDSLQMTL